MRFRQSLDIAGFTLVELLVVIAIIGVLVSLLLPAVLYAREAARRVQCLNNLKQVGLALHGHHAALQRFPTGGVIAESGSLPLSWNVFLLPYLELNSVYGQFDIQPNGTGNSIGGATLVGEFLCPDEDPHQTIATVGQKSSYSGVSGAGKSGAFRDLEDLLCGNVYLDGILYPLSRTQIKEITDGTSRTLCIGECSYLFADWMTGTIQYSDLMAQCMYSTKNVRHPINGSWEVYGYFSLHKPTPPEGAKVMLRNDLIFGSHHPGGAHFLLADGSVRFLADSLALTVYQDLSTRDGEEVVELP